MHMGRSFANVHDSDDIWRKAFDLAHFLHEDRAIALRIVFAAMCKLQAATSAQKKRLYYKPRGRLLPYQAQTNNFRFKPESSELLLLQRLIYIESEPFEKQNETAGDDDQMLIYFIKHLVRITLKRNSFYLTLGMSRLLHNYSTAETMDIYSVVVQDPERAKDNYYYRSRKAVLLKELKERFGPLLNTCRGPSGEERIQHQPPVDRHLDLVEKCLSFFTPWRTLCPLPIRFDPMFDEINNLSSRSPEGEDAAELNRLHSILHPNCFQRLIAALKLDDPSSKLLIPLFAVSARNNGNGNSGNGHRKFSPLTDLELAELKNLTAEHSTRRKKSSVSWLRVYVDSVERARLDPMNQQEVQLSLRSVDELVEVRGFDSRSNSELLLATHLLDQASANRRFESEITLEGGQRISISVEWPAQTIVNDGIATVRFYEKRFARLFRFGSVPFPSLLQRPAAVLSLVSTLILASAGGLLYRNYQNRETQEIARIDLSPFEVKPDLPPTTQDRNIDKSGASRKPRTKPLGSETDLTRGGTSNVAGKRLAEVRTIYLNVEEYQPANVELLSSLRVQLETRGRFKITSDKDQADASLNLRASSGNDQLSIAVELVNVKGEVLWPLKQSNRYSGTAERVAANISRNLHRAIQKK